MSSSRDTQYEQLSRDQAARVDEACDEFETAWKAVGTDGRPPDLHAILVAFQDPERTVLARELIALDRAYRQRRGAAPQLTDYLGLCADGDPPLAVNDVTPKHLPAGFPASPDTFPHIPGCEIVGVLGSGGMGIVYKARQTALDRYIAVKMLRGTGLTDTDQYKRFFQEARAVAHLQHPNLVQVYEIGEAHGLGGGASLPYFVLEYVRGGSLAQYLQGEPQPPREVARLMETIARAVQHAHEHGIIHRDLKPGNILLHATDDAEASLSSTDRPLASFAPKIADFGVARLGDSSHLTQTGDILGTPSYMAPEQTEGKGAAIGPTADVYGLGAILYEMLTGRPPFRAETVLATVLQVRDEEPVSVHRLQPTVPRDLETICLKCLQKDRRNRYATAAAFADDLRRFLDGRPIAARPVGVGERALKWVRRRPAVAALLIAVVVVAALGFMGVLWQWGQTVAALNESRLAHDATKAHLYFNQIARARHELVANHVSRAERLLEETPAAARGWEWRYLKGQCQTNLFAMRGNGSPIHAVAYSPDGCLVVSGSGDWYGGRDGELVLWDAETGQRRQTLARDIGTVYGVAFDPDGRRMASASSDGFVRIWEMPAGRLFRDLPRLAGRANCVAFSPDGSRIACGAWNAVVSVWEVETGRRLLTLTNHRAPVWSVAFSPDGQQLASGDRDGVGHLWDLASGEPVRSFGGFVDIRTLAFSPDRNWLAFGCFSGPIVLWDLQRANTPPVVHHPNAGPISSLRFAPNGNLVWSSRDGSVRIQDRRTGSDRYVFRGHDGFCRSVAIHPDGRRLATGGSDGTVRIWDATAYDEPPRYLTDAADISGLAYVGPNDQLVALGGVRGTTTVWDVATQKAIFSQSGKADPAAAAVSPDGRFWAWVGDGKTLRVRDHAAQVEVWSREISALPVTGLAYSADSRLLAWGAADGIVRVCDAVTGDEVSSTGRHGAPITGVAFHPNGQLLATAGRDGTYCLWPLPSGAAVARFGESAGDAGGLAEPEHDGERSAPATVTRLAFSPDCSRLAAANPRRPLEIWDVSTGRVALILDWGTEGPSSVAWSADGHRIAAAIGSKVKVWDASPRSVEERRRATVESALGWHRNEAKWAEGRGDWFAAVYHLGKLIRDEPETASHYARRGNAWGGLADDGRGGWDDAAADITKAVELQCDAPEPWYQQATFALVAGDRDRYRATCAAMLSRFADTREPYIANLIAWACTLTDGAVSEPARIVELASRAAAKKPPNPNYQNTHGVALYRAGRYAEARSRLMEVLNVRRTDGTAMDCLYLAMVQHRLDEPAEARKWFDRAVGRLARTDRNHMPGEARMLDWEERLFMPILRREAEDLLNKARP